jgi:hypothetical protein
MSVRVSTFRASRTCSGDMYIGDPSVLPVVVTLRGPSSATAFDTPKSSTFTSPDPSVRRVRKRFAGFKSRCTMPRACASATASHAWRT